jgi:hypothetical protein
MNETVNVAAEKSGEVPVNVPTLKPTLTVPGRSFDTTLLNLA